MIDGIYDKTSKIAFSAYKNDFLEFFGEYRKIIEELGTEVHTLHGSHRRLDKLVLVDDDTLQNWEFEFKQIGEDTLTRIWGYNNLKSAEIGKIMDSFIISFANPDWCDEEVKIGRSITFAPIIKYLQMMELPKRLSTIEDKVKNDRIISIRDELTLIFVALSVSDKDKESIVKRVCSVLDQIDYIKGYHRIVIDSLISFQIENFVKSAEEQDNLNEVVNMQLSVEELFIQAEREYEYDRGYDCGRSEGRSEGLSEGLSEGVSKGKDEVILKMLDESFDDETIQKCTGCSLDYIHELKQKSGK